MTKVYTLSEWFGRFGNNIQQISNMIHMAQVDNCCFLSPEHGLIKEFGTFRSSLSREDIQVHRNEFYFYGEDRLDRLHFNCDKEDLNQKRENIIKEFIVPNLKWGLNSIPALSDQTLVIHIRSGDNFVENWKPPEASVHPVVHPCYVMNPFSFYESLIRRFEKVIVVTEKDRKNPMLKKIDKFNNVSIRSGTLVEDLKIILAAKHFATSGVGTFGIAAALLSNNLENFYCTDLFLKEHLNPTMLMKSKIFMTPINQDDYIKIGTWTASPPQIELMLTS